MRAGELLGERYQLVRELGRGGFGVVWEAYDRRLGRQVAVKTLHQNHDRAAASDLARLRREVEVLARLAHPHIVVVFDLGEVRTDEELFSYVVMELLGGPTLAQVMAAGRCELPLALEWARQLCTALGAAHAARVVHRDVKPENIMFGAADRAVLKVLDFGIAQYEDNQDPLTTTGSVIGSVRYLAPERWRGEPGTAGSDLYAVGCVLYELFTGQRPFTATQHYGLMVQHQEHVPERPAALPADVADLVMDLLAKDPEQRPADAAQVARRLARAAEAVRGLRRRADAAFVAATEGRAADAVRELQDVIPQFALTFGPQDGRTLRTCHDLAVSLERAGRRAEAYGLLRELLPAAERALGERHQDVEDLRHRLERTAAELTPAELGNPEPPAGLLAELLGAVNRMPA
ncbi:hypothetical protein GCM10009665_48930 [Kitasatospora nipponensis]|uniref:non-specific serine/threonine protein kinase n=1 Tax=Kitasatospora nipponensis TaxID=258049 RepID=A0ABP4HBP7_9ACTN